MPHTELICFTQLEGHVAALGMALFLLVPQTTVKERVTNGVAKNTPQTSSLIRLSCYAGVLSSQQMWACCNGCLSCMGFWREKIAKVNRLLWKSTTLGYGLLLPFMKLSDGIQSLSWTTTNPSPSDSAKGTTCSLEFRNGGSALMDTQRLKV